LSCKPKREKGCKPRITAVLQSGSQEEEGLRGALAEEQQDCATRHADVVITPKRNPAPVAKSCFARVAVPQEQGIFTSATVSPELKGRPLDAGFVLQD
jgi:predicted NAD/FAD-binding protein